MTPSWTLRTNVTLADFGIIKDMLEKYENERRDVAQKTDLFNMDKPPRKSNSSYGTPEDLIDLESDGSHAEEKASALLDVSSSSSPRHRERRVGVAHGRIDREGG